MHLKFYRVSQEVVNIAGSTYLLDLLVACFQFELAWALGLLQSAVKWESGEKTQ